MQTRSIVFAIVAVLSAGVFDRAQADYTVRTDLTATQQTIEGWGASLAHWDATARTMYAGEDFRRAFRDLGLNILRVDMQKEVLIASPDDFATPVALGGDMNDNLAKMNFNRPSTAAFGELAQWLQANALEPDEVRINGSLWTPPHWMKGPTGTKQTFVGVTPEIPTPFLSNQYFDPNNPSATGDSVGGRLLTEDAYTVDQYGKYIASWVKGFEQAYGVDFHSVNLQNESSYENPFGSMTFTLNAQGKNDFSQFAVALAGVKQAWKEFGLGTKVMGPGVANFDEANLWMQNEMIKGVKDYADRSLIDFLDYYSANFYNGTSESAVKAVAGFYHGGTAVDPNLVWGNDNYANPPGVAQDGKGIWYLETGGEPGTWPGALDVALKMHNALVYSNASAYVYWQLADADPTVSEHTLVGSADIKDPVSSKKYAAFKQFSRFIRPKAVRLDANFDNGDASVGGASRYDTSNGVDISAYWEEGEGRLTYVLINALAKDERITLNLPEGLTLQTMQAYRTSETENFAALGDLQIVDGGLIYSAPGKSITTFTGVAP